MQLEKLYTDLKIELLFNDKFYLGLCFQKFLIKANVKEREDGSVGLGDGVVTKNTIVFFHSLFRFIHKIFLFLHFIMEMSRLQFFLLIFLGKGEKIYYSL